MNPWRVLAVEAGAPHELLARSAALLERLSEEPVPALRWYRSDSAAVVLGRGQRADLLADPALDHTTRFSGGGAVFMDADLLCLDVLIPTGHPWLGGDLSQVFLRVGAAWARGLTALGVPDLAVHHGPVPRREDTPRGRLLAAICYAQVGRGEVTSGGRKLVGLSQRRRRAGALVQCGLLRRWRPAALLSALGSGPDDAGITAAAIGIDELLTTMPAEGDIRRCVETAFAEVASAPPWAE